jgi:hypothetical protein
MNLALRVVLFDPYAAEPVDAEFEDVIDPELVDRF